MIKKIINNNRIYLIYLSLFLIFSIFISLGIFFLNKYYHKDINKIIQKEAKEIIFDKRQLFNSYLNSSIHFLNTISKDKLFTNYLLEKNNNEVVSNLFLTFLNTNKYFYQLRYISKDGQENIRIERDNITNQSLITSKKSLQNKKNRDYFQDTIKLKKNDILISKLDLNIEHNKIEQPIVPVIRISTPIYYKHKLYGILILNLRMTDILDTMINSSFYDIAVIDQDGEIIYGPLGNYMFTKYLNTNLKIQNLYNIPLKNILDNKTEIYSKKLMKKSRKLNFEENLYIIAKVNNTFKKYIEKEHTDYGIFLSLFIIAMSIPVAFIISIYPTRIRKELDKLLKRNQESLKIIDEYIINTTIDKNQKITHVSKAFEKLSGYKAEELLGKKYKIFKKINEAPNYEKEAFQTFQTINKKKSGELYWLETTLTPIFDEDKDIVGYKSFCVDITNRKKLEKIAQTDRLTQVYNRVKLDSILEQQLYKANRYGTVFSVILLDIDKFKSINDNFGHQVGDSVLIELSNILKKDIRLSDVVGRWGGEEFLIISPQTDINGVYKLAEKLRKSIEEFEFKTVKNVTASFGVSSYENGDNAHSIVYKCDMALYKSKENGRNKVTKG